MTKRLLPPAFFALAAVAASTGCSTPDDPTELREAYVDDWETVATLPAAQFDYLSIGDRLASDNFANRGDIEVRYVSGTSDITVEMQRFTVAPDQAGAEEAFDRMQYWGYDKSTPEQPSDEIAEDSCENPEVSSCYIRAYYDGMRQPLRDGANFRVTLPEGWVGDIDLVTSDNLESGIETYPDRSDIIVDGLNGNLEVDMDSGNIQVRLDPGIQHYATCSPEANDTCVEMGYAMGCGCSEPTNVTIANNSGQASNITVDVGNPDLWYYMVLENRGTFSSSDDFVCNATIQCDDFGAGCLIEDAYAGLAYHERAEINYPGEPAINGAGIRISLVSEACANITYVNGPDDYEAEDLPEEKRGDLLACVGCLSDL